jgi:hypothetical protein
MNLSSNSLENVDSSDVFEGLRRLKVLKLSRNNLHECNKPLEESSSPFSKLIELTHLDLSENNFTTLHENIFVGLRNLAMLDLRWNKIKMTRENFPPDEFKPINSLKELRLGGNFDVTKGRHDCFDADDDFYADAGADSDDDDDDDDEDIETNPNNDYVDASDFTDNDNDKYAENEEEEDDDDNAEADSDTEYRYDDEEADENAMAAYPDKALRVLTSLETLTMNGLINISLPEELGSMLSLRNLSLSGMRRAGFCNLGVVNDSTFQHAPPMLKMLNISGCNITKLTNTSLLPFKKTLKVLDLSANQRLGFHMLGEALYSFRGKNRKHAQSAWR